MPMTLDMLLQAFNTLRVLKRNGETLKASGSTSGCDRVPSFDPPALDQVAGAGNLKIIEDLSSLLPGPAFGGLPDPSRFDASVAEPMTPASTAVPAAAACVVRGAVAVTIAQPRQLGD